MYKFKKILVGLDLSELDVDLIQYTSLICNIFNPEQVTFMHVIREVILPDEIQEKFPDYPGSLDERIHEELQGKIDENFNYDAPTKITIEIKEGKPADKILTWTGIKETDLLIMGSKRSLKGEGVLPGKMVKLLHCSVLLVPEKTPLKISKILIPTDFSQNSQMAMEQAQSINKAIDVEIICHHSYSVPSGYHLSGKSYEEFAEIMKGHAQKEFGEFLKACNIKNTINCHFTLDDHLHHDPAEQAFQLANDKEADLIIIGSRGRKSSLVGIILGSVAEKMARYDKSIPLLIVKDKTKNLGILEALLKL